jgi:hypothetical protein
VPGYVATDGRERSDGLDRQSCSHPKILPQPKFGASTKVVRKLVREWTNTKSEELCQPICGEKQFKAVLRGPLVKQVGNCSV